MAYEIFISYKRLDKEKVFMIKDEIEKVVGKDTCWIDMDGIESDAQFADVIINAINRAQIFLFMYSRHHTEITKIDKDWTVREINFAEKKEKRIVFVNIDGTPLTDWFEMMFGTKQQVDASSKQAMQKLYQDLNKWLTESPNKGPVDGPNPIPNPNPTGGFFVKLRQLFRPYTKNRKPLYVAISAILLVLIGIVGWNLYDPQHSEDPVLSTDDIACEIDSADFISTAEPAAPITSTSSSASGSSADAQPVVSEQRQVSSSSLQSAREGAATSSSTRGSSANNSPTTTPKVSKTNNKILTYTASKKLDLEASRFTPAFISHTFDGEIGTITFPEDVNSIGEQAFFSCYSLQSITIPNGVTSIGDNALCYCASLQSITIPNGVKSIGVYAFGCCSSLQSITIPNSVTSIGNGAFWDCTSLQSITIPNSVTSIGNRAFDGCESLRSITIPNSVTSIGYEAFDGCNSLREIRIPRGTRADFEGLLSDYKDKLVEID